MRAISGDNLSSFAKYRSRAQDAEVSTLKRGQLYTSDPGLPGTRGNTEHRTFNTENRKVPGQTRLYWSPYNTKSGRAKGDVKFRSAEAKMWMLVARV